MTGLNAGGLAIIRFENKVKVLDCFGELPGKQNSNASLHADTRSSPPKRVVTLELVHMNITYHI